MRGFVLVLGLIAAWAASALASGAVAAELVSPDELKSGWLDGRTVTTTGPRGGTSTLVFGADGKVTRSGGRAGSATGGAWRVDEDGFCMTLGSARRESCYLAIRTADGALKVVRRQASAFTWRR